MPENTMIENNETMVESNPETVSNEPKASAGEIAGTVLILGTAAYGAGRIIYDVFKKWIIPGVKKGVQNVKDAREKGKHEPAKEQPKIEERVVKKTEEGLEIEPEEVK